MPKSIDENSIIPVNLASIAKVAGCRTDQAILILKQIKNAFVERSAYRVCTLDFKIGILESKPYGSLSFLE